MHLNLVTAPAETPISVADVKAHLRISHTAEDGVLAALVAAAVALVDGPTGYLRRALVSQTWRAIFDGSPRSDIVKLPIPPLVSVDTVEYYDANNALQTLATSNYDVVLPHGAAGYVELSATGLWPGTANRPDALQIEFTAGYGDADAVPGAIKQALLLIVGSLYARRGDDDGADPIGPGAQRLLAPYRWREFAG